MSQTVDMILNSSPKPDFDFKNDNEFEPGSKGCSETASDTSEKQNKKLGKREGCDYLVFGFWFLSNARRDGLITDELFTQLTEKMHLFDDCDQQREFMSRFVAKDNFKAHEKDLKLAVKSHAAALKPAKNPEKPNWTLMLLSLSAVALPSQRSITALRNKNYVMKLSRPLRKLLSIQRKMWMFQMKNWIWLRRLHLLRLRSLRKPRLLRLPRNPRKLLRSLRFLLWS